MNELITIKAKSKTGQIISLQVLALLEVDGRPYQPAELADDLRQHVAFLDGRLTAVERIIGGQTSEGIEHG